MGLDDKNVGRGNARIQAASIHPKQIPEGFFGVLKRARNAMREQLGEIDFTRAEIHEKLAAATGIQQEDVLRDIERHLLSFPEQPRDGFPDVVEYGHYVASLNALLATEHFVYMDHPDEFRLRDPENKEKFRAHILTECADGRNSFTMFFPADKMLGRFDIEWLPVAGDIIFPEIEQPQAPRDVAMQLTGNFQLREKIFDRLDMMYGNKVKESLQEYAEGTLSKVFIEFQSHFDSKDAGHGCGAHNSDLTAAQLETVKDCLVTDEWLKNRYPEQYAKGLFRVFRSVHDTGEGRPIFVARAIDKSLPKEARDKYSDLFEYANQKFESPVKKSEDIVREYKGNPTAVETETHDEQTIRISNTHLASTLNGQSVLEISWLNDAHIMYQHLQVLLGIVDRNYRKRHPDRPAIIHFDLVTGNDKILAVFKELEKILMNDEKIAQRHKEGSLRFWITETDPVTYEMTIPSDSEIR